MGPYTHHSDLGQGKTFHPKSIVKAFRISVPPPTPQTLNQINCSLNIAHFLGYKVAIVLSKAFISDFTSSSCRKLKTLMWKDHKYHLKLCKSMYRICSWQYKYLCFVYQWKHRWIRRSISQEDHTERIHQVQCKDKINKI